MFLDSNKLRFPDKTQVFLMSGLILPQNLSVSHHERKDSSFEKFSMIRKKISIIRMKPENF